MWVYSVTLVNKDRYQVLNESGIPDIRTTLSPFNRNEDCSSEPKVRVSLRPSVYTDMVWVSVLEDDMEEVAVDFKFKVNDNGKLEVSVIDGYGEHEKLLYTKSIDKIKKGQI